MCGGSGFGAASFLVDLYSPSLLDKLLDDAPSGRDGAVTRHTVDQIKAALPRFATVIPPSMKIDTIGDRTQTIRASVHDVEFTPRSAGDLTLRIGFPPATRPDGTPVPFPPPTRVPVHVR